MSLSPSNNSFFEKPERHFIVYRFFFFCLALQALLSACAPTQVIAGKQSDSTSGLQQQGDAAFMEAVKQKIMGNTDRSFDYFTHYSRKYPQNATAHYELARIWLERNHVPNALKEVKLAYGIDSNNKWIHTLYADLLAYDGQYLAAANEFSQLAHKQSRSPEDYLVRQAMLYQKAEAYGDAIKVLDTLGRFIGADDEVLLLQKQQLYLQMNDVEGAAGEVKKLMEYYPSNTEYPMMLGNIYLNNGDEERAASVFRQVETNFPNDLDVQFGLMQYYAKIHDTVSLHEVIVRTFSQKELDTRTRIDMLIPLLQQSNTHDGSKALGKRLAYQLAHEEPPHTLALLLYGDLLSMDNQLDSALIFYKRATQIDSTNYLPWQQIMMNFASNMQMDSVAFYSIQAIGHFPEEPTAYYFGGIAFNQLSQPEKAVDLLNIAVKLQKDDNEALKSEMLSTLGDAYNSLKDFEAADSSYEAALALFPDNVTALNNYSYYLSLRGERLEDAAKMSQRTLMVRPDDPTFLDTYAWVLFKQEKFEAAKVQIEKAIKLSGTDIDATLYEHLGDIEFKLGNKEAAVEAWKKASEKGGASVLIDKKIKDKQLYE